MFRYLPDAPQQDRSSFALYQFFAIMNIEVQEYLPSESLRPYVQRFWTGRFNAQSVDCLAQRVMPNGFLEVIIHLTDHHCDLPASAGWDQSPSCTLIGLQSEAYEVRFTREVKVFAIRFKPAGFYSLFGILSRELVNTHEDLVAVLGTAFRAFAARLQDDQNIARQLLAAEQYLHQAIGTGDITYLNRAAELIRISGGKMQVADVASQLCISKRQLERAFRSKLGLTPKQYMRIARLNFVQQLVQRGRFQSLAEIAHMAGYTDQPHFNREFKLLVGEQPTRFLADQGLYTASTMELV